MSAGKLCAENFFLSYFQFDTYNTSNGAHFDGEEAGNIIKVKFLVFLQWFECCKRENEAHKVLLMPLQGKYLVGDVIPAQIFQRVLYST